MRNKAYKRLLALLLCTVLFFGQLGASAYAERGAPDTGSLRKLHLAYGARDNIENEKDGEFALGLSELEEPPVIDSGNAPENVGTITVTAFEDLDGGVKVQSYPIGAPESSVYLPATLGASGYTVTEDTEPAPESITITDVTWKLTGENNSPTTYEDGREAPCNYYFQPVLPDGYTLAGGASPPKIEVRYGWGYRAMSNPNVTRANDYHPDDIAAFQQILLDHPELASIPGVDMTDPVSWSGTLVGWDAASKPYKLTSLYLDAKGLMGTLNVSGLSNLKILRCSGNAKLTGLTLGTLNDLTEIHCSSSGISGTLDVSNCPELNKIWCNYAPYLTTLNLGTKNKLTEIHCSISGLSGDLDVSNCSQLVTLGCSNNPALTGLELGQQDYLIELKCNDTGINGDLDVSNCPNLKTLWCHGNPGLTSLNLGAKDNLLNFRCSSTGLSGTLDVSNCPKLQALWCSDNPALTGLKLGTLNDLTTLFCFSTGIRGVLDVSNCPNLEMLYCSDNPATTGLNLGTLDKLISLICINTGLGGALDVSNCPKLQILRCNDSKLKTLNVFGTALTWFDCFNNPLTSFTTMEGRTLTVEAEPGGKAYMTNYILSKNRAELTAIPNRNYMFNTWLDLPSGAANTETTSFVLSDDISVCAYFTYSGDSSNRFIQPPEPNNPMPAVIELPVTVRDGTATGQLDDVRTAAALAEARRDANAKANGIAVQYNVIPSPTFDEFSITIQQATLDRLLDAKVKVITLNTGIVDLTFDLAALDEIRKQAAGDVALNATREAGLAGDVLAAVGSRPAYRLTVSYTNEDGKPAAVSDFGAGRVAVGLAYTPAAEQAGGLYLVYSKNGKDAEWFHRSGYDKNSGNVIGSVGHFSVYGVGYTPAPAFTDTVNHWAKADIDFVASRGLLTGTNDTTFTPDGPITRGMFVTALGRLAGIDPADYPSSSRFTDVPADAYYAPYVRWAASNGIVIGTKENSFSPDAEITREQMAAIMQRYADNLEVPLPVARKGKIFADDANITGRMKAAVWVMQQAGVMNGKDGNRFGPRDTATRAEAAAVLHRFVKIAIDRTTAGGWAQNDAGSWLYYLDAKPVTGWKQIGDEWYYFYTDGVMAANTTIDGYGIGPDGVRKEKIG